MLDIELLIRWWLQGVKTYFNGLYRFKLYRWHKGGLWLKFSNNTWVQTVWVDKTTGYIRHPQDGGVFHKRFNLIVKIEDYT